MPCIPACCALYMHAAACCSQHVSFLCLRWSGRERREEEEGGHEGKGKRSFSIPASMPQPDLPTSPNHAACLHTWPKESPALALHLPPCLCMTLLCLNDNTWQQQQPSLPSPHAHTHMQAAGRGDPILAFLALKKDTPTFAACALRGMALNTQALLAFCPQVEQTGFSTPGHGGRLGGQEGHSSMQLAACWHGLAAAAALCVAWQQHAPG